MKDQLEALVAQMHSSGILFSEGTNEFKKRFILHVLKECKGNQCRAARELNMHRNTLSRTIAELKLDVRQFKRDNGRNGSRKPVQSTIARCYCTGRGTWHVLYGPSCTQERAQAAKAGA